MTVRTLHTYQAEAVDAAVSGLTDGGRGQLIMACGTGKTLVAVRTADRLVPAADGLVVILVPTLALVAQTLTVWQADSNRRFSALAVCSDDTTADAPVHVTDITDRAQVTTNPDAIRAWLTTQGQRGVIVGTYRSAAHLADALHAESRCADLLVCDEAHHLAGRTDFVTARCLDDTIFPAHRRLFLTATPRAYSAAVERRVDMLSMNDETVFGPVLYTYSFAQAIAEERLDDYRVAVIGITDSDAHRMLVDSGTAYVDRRGDIDLRGLVAQAALAKAARRYSLRRVVSFHPRVADAAEFTRTLSRTVDQLPDEQRPAGTLVATHVHGEMDSRTREQHLNELRHPPDDGWVNIANVRVLGEGVDVPAIDAVTFAHAKTSSVDIVQAVGRALRRNPDSSGTATIVVPIVVPDAGGEIGDVDAREYDTLWRVVRALRAHDETLGLELDLQRSHAHTEAEDPIPPSRITMILPEGTTDRILRDLTVLLVRNTTSPWWEGYGHARDYVAEHGHLLPSADFKTADGYPLGQWIAHRRHHRRKGWLSPDRIAMLDKLGMIWNPFDEAWQAGYHAARHFYTQQHHLRVGSTYHTDEGFPLGRWVARQRNRYQQDKLDAEKVAALEEIGMIWNAFDLAWQLGYTACVAFHREHGHLNIPKDYRTSDGYQLGAWLNSRRRERRHGQLRQERITALDDLGIEWEPIQARWTTGYDAARTFYSEHGHLRVHHGYRTADGYNLGAWILHQRQLRNGVKRGGISVDRIAALDAIGMQWSATTDV